MKPVEIVKLFEDEIYLRIFVDYYISVSMNWNRVTDKFGFHEEEFREALNKSKSLSTKFYEAICDRSLNTAIEALPTALRALTDVLTSLEQMDENVKLKAVTQLMAIMKELRPKAKKDDTGDDWEKEIDQLYKGLNHGANEEPGKDS